MQQDKLTIISMQKCKLKSKCSFCFNCAPLTIISYYTETFVMVSYFGKPEKPERRNFHRCVLACDKHKQQIIASSKN